MNNYFNIGNEGFHCVFSDARENVENERTPILDYPFYRSEYVNQNPMEMLPPALAMMKAASRSRLREDSGSDSEGSGTKSPLSKEARETSISPQAIKLTKECLDPKANEITEEVIDNIKTDPRNQSIINRYETFKAGYVKNPSKETKGQLDKATKLMQNHGSNLLKGAYIRFCSDQGDHLSSEMAKSLADKLVVNLPKIINQLTRN